MASKGKVLFGDAHFDPLATFAWHLTPSSPRNELRAVMREFFPNAKATEVVYCNMMYAEFRSPMSMGSRGQSFAGEHLCTGPGEPLVAIITSPAHQTPSGKCFADP